MKTLQTATLQELKKEYQDIAGAWNGKDAGVLEDRATMANDILDTITSLEGQIENFDF